MFVKCAVVQQSNRDTTDKLIIRVEDIILVTRTAVHKPAGVYLDILIHRRLYHSEL